MIRTIIIDGYQTCIETGDDALTVATEEAIKIIFRNSFFSFFDGFFQEYEKACFDVAEEKGVDNPILLDDFLLYKRAFANMGLDISEEKVQRFVDLKWNVFSRIVFLYPDTKKSLLDLKKNYDLKLCVDGCSKYEQKVMDKLGLNLFFSNIIVTDQFGSSKQKKETWIKLLKKIDCEPSEVLVVDDKPKVLATVSSLGIETVRVRRGKYRERDNIILPDLEVSSLSELVTRGRKIFKKAN